MKYFSLFTGIGGFEKGILQAYENYSAGQGGSQQTLGLGHSGSGGASGYDRKLDLQAPPICAGFSEIDKYATSIYQYHFPDHKNYGDITKINARELPDFDLLVGGFPCQAFSVAGLRRGFDDTRGTLFFDIARILREKRPRYLMLENVKGLLSHDGGRTIKIIISTLADMGYDLQWQVLNSKNFGVPQNRERVFIVGHLRGEPRPQVFPIRGSYGNYIKEITKSVPQAQRVYDHTGISPTIDVGAGGNRQPKIIQRSPDYRKDGSLRRFEDYSPTIRAQMGDNHPMVLAPMPKYGKGKERSVSYSTPDVSPTIKSTIAKRGDTDPLIMDEDMAIRRLTPLECERLQGFPDHWTWYGYEKGLPHYLPISDTQRYKCIGNAVTVNVVQAVIERIFYGEKE